MFTYQAFQILLFLIPGLIASKILYLTVHTTDTKEQDKIINALIFTMFIYAIYAMITGNPPISYTEIDGIFIYNYKSLILLITLSIIIPLIFSWFIVKDWHMLLLRKLHITRNTSRSSTWLDIFYENFKSDITIEFADGSRICGYPDYYSDNPSEQFIYLKHPAWVIENKKTKDYSQIYLDVDGILITPHMKIQSILFHNPNAERDTSAGKNIPTAKKPKVPPPQKK
ncbi:MAG: DUF6338 family protein [Leptospirales bacterium]|nr:DUF6338 family protein [Leptospirales bacterium]